MTQFSPLLAGMHPVLALLLVAAILAVAMVPVYFLMILPAIRKREAEEAAKVARIELRGKPVYAWIVMAHDDLYKENQFGDDRMAQVIYTEETLPNPDQTLATIAEKLRSFRAGPDATDEERRIS